MDKLENYRHICQTIVMRHAQHTASHGQIEPLPICDANTDNYLLMDIGWDKNGRVHAVVFHLRLREGKVWIEWDGIEYGIARDLLEAGVLKEDIVLGFYRPEKRALTELTVTQ